MIRLLAQCNLRCCKKSNLVSLKNFMWVELKYWNVLIHVLARQGHTRCILENCGSEVSMLQHLVEKLSEGTLGSVGNRRSDPQQKWKVHQIVEIYMHVLSSLSYCTPVICQLSLGKEPHHMIDETFPFLLFREFALPLQACSHQVEFGVCRVSINNKRITSATAYINLKGIVHMFHHDCSCETI